MTFIRTPSSQRARKCSAKQLALGRQDDVRRLVLHPLFDERHRHARQIRAERLKAQQQRAIDGPKKPRHALHVENVDELIGRPMRPPRAERLIRELHQRRLVVRRLDHPIQLGLLPPLLRRLQLPRPLAQHARQVHRLRDLHRPRRAAIARILGQQAIDVLLDVQIRLDDDVDDMAM